MYPKYIYISYTKKYMITILTNLFENIILNNVTLNVSKIYLYQLLNMQRQKIGISNNLNIILKIFNNFHVQRSIYINFN